MKPNPANSCKNWPEAPGQDAHELVCLCHFTGVLRLHMCIYILLSWAVEQLCRTIPFSKAEDSSRSQLPAATFETKEGQRTEQLPLSFHRGPSPLDSCHTEDIWTLEQQDWVQEPAWVGWHRVKRAVLPPCGLIKPELLHPALLVVTKLKGP